MSFWKRPVAEIVECPVMGQQTVREVDGEWKFLKVGDKLYSAEQIRQAMILPEGEIVVTTNEDGHIVAVTRQDEDGVVLSVLAISQPIYKPEEKIAGYQVWWGVGDMQPVDTLFKTRQEAEEYANLVKSNTEIRTLYYKS